MQTFRAQTTVIDTISCSSSDSHDLSIFHSNVQPAAITAQNTRTLDPFFWLFVCRFVNTSRPDVSVGRPRSPDVLNRVARLMLWCLSNPDLGLHDAGSLR